jgi:hypothetical protein
VQGYVGCPSSFTTSGGVDDVNRCMTRVHDKMKSIISERLGARRNNRKQRRREQEIKE